MTKTIEELRQRAQEVAELSKSCKLEAMKRGINNALDTRKEFEVASVDSELLGYLLEVVDDGIAMAQLIADQQAKIEELEKQTQWQSIAAFNVTLDEVLVTDGFNVATATYRKSNKLSDSPYMALSNFDGISLDMGLYAQYIKATHWMPLPTPPKENAK